MTQKRLKITFKNTQDQTKTLEWTVREHLVTNKWLRLLYKIKTGPEFGGSNDWFSVGYSQEHLDKYFDQIKEICSQINQSEGIKIPVEWLETISVENLNQLHLLFHQLAEEKWLNDDDTQSVDQLNYLVHKIESTMRNIQSKRRNGVGVIGFNIGNHVDLTPEDRTCFDSYTVESGTLRVGYTTIGKSLYDCFLNKDLAVLEQNMVRPKMTLGAEVYLNLGDKSVSSPNPFYAWCDQNNIKEKYGLDCRDPMHSPGECVLADPVDWTEQEMMDWVISSDQVWVDHWEVVL